MEAFEVVCRGKSIQFLNAAIRVLKHKRRVAINNIALLSFLASDYLFMPYKTMVYALTK
jgi:hypothetical protein